MRSHLSAKVLLDTPSKPLDAKIDVLVVTHIGAYQVFGTLKNL